MLAIFRCYAFPGARRWQNAREMRSPASDGGNILARCVLGGLAVARFRRGAFLGVNPWQVLRSMHPKNGLGRKNRQFVARFARHASEMSWLRQDMRAVHPKSPANSRLGMHRANILPGRGPFRCAGPSDHARRADLATPRQRRTAPGHRADASRRSSSDARGARRTRGGVFQLMLQEQLRFLPPRRTSKRAVRLPWCAGPNPLAISTSSMRKARRSLSTTMQGSRRPSRPNRASTSTVSRCTRLISPSFAL